MVSRDPRTKVHEIREISFDWPNPQHCQISSRSDKKVCEVSVVEKSCSRKSRPKFTLGLHICHQSIGSTRVSIDTLYSNFGHRLLRFRDIDSFVSKMLLFHIPCRLSGKLWKCSHTVRSMGSVVQSAMPLN